ncbi:DUF2846 domain-containing protein [Luteimonas gilva]|uniref:DUF2846 domain-containing protein n=1 Tax=Luteimonas gilva TaxID=2572684 RepID=A0A4U5JVW8_9GAMM|nr:DUF2846 domain-containing protein [Luteimonas gilva]TKR33765.1 DUF2846 domain-containing protein [Luteimonas gilva]
MNRSIRHAVFVLSLLPAFAFAGDGSLSWRKDKGELDPSKRVQVAAAQTASPQSAEAPAQQAQPAPAAASAQEAQAAAAAEPSAAPASAAANGLIGAPPSGKGQIVFFRPSKFAGAAVGFKVREGQTELGKLRSGKYFVAAVDPGQHQYTVHSEAEDVLTMEIEAGETYYVQGTINMGFLVGRPNLSPSDAATFNGMAAKLEKAQ